MIKYNLLILISLLIIFSDAIYGAKILFVSAPGSASHRRSLFPLAENLAKNGHDVTMFAEIYEEDNAKGKNLTNKIILLDVPHGDEENLLNDLIWNTRAFKPFMMLFPWSGCAKMTEALLEQKKFEFDDILKENWELIVVDALFTPTGVLFAALMNKPYVLYQTTAMGSPESIARSLPFPTSTFPSLFMPETNFDQSNFIDRLGSTWSESSLFFFTNIVISNFIMRYKFSYMISDLSLISFYGDADSSFLECPTELDYPRPRNMETIGIGGKCKSATLQDKSLLEFVEDPNSKGTIVIAFGHMVKWDGAPAEVRRDFARAMNALKEYRIIWQYKGEPEIKMEAHVRTMAWLPQTELLNHPKTKAFVSHGGMKSIMEAICGEVPMVLVPFFAEQTRNGFLLKRANAGKTINKWELTFDTIKDTVTAVASDDKYRKGIARLKWSILDKPISPENNALFWSNYIIRHKGLPKKYFRIKGSTMNFITYFCIDIIATTSFAVAVLSFLIVKAFSFVHARIK